SQISTNISMMRSKFPALERYDRPSPLSDRLYQATFHHPPGNTSCCDCPTERTVPRVKRHNENEPRTHYGIIASGSSVIKDAIVRDSIRDDCGAIAFEMEAAGLMHDL